MQAHFKSLQTTHLTYILERALPLLMKEGTEEVTGLETDEDDKQMEHQAAARAMYQVQEENQC